MNDDLSRISAFFAAISEEAVRRVRRRSPEWGLDEEEVAREVANIAEELLNLLDTDRDPSTDGLP